MTEIGYALSSEEHAPRDLVANARAAEEAGFTFALISDHFHPWIDRQGHSPFVWGVLGAIAQATDRLSIGTGVTCPTIRTHPAIIAQAAATTAALMPGRFFLGLGTGENLNEHVVGRGWPSLDVRTEMLEEAVEVIRELWKGQLTNHRGRHFTIENARLYTLPDRLPPIYLAASGPKAAEQAGRLGDGLIGTGPEAELVTRYRSAGGDGPRYGQVTVCWAASEAEAKKTVREWWPNVAVHGAASQELPLPSHFEELTSSVTEDQVAESVPCGPDAERHLEKIRAYLDAGFDHVYIHQVGPDQRGFIDFARRELLPALDRQPANVR
ncbi:MAG: TIGR03557 family F420-dependent LLM class oxidoreductase [Chloroflexota bacterium]